MRPEKIREALRAVPFRRLRVYLSDGTVHEIPHPEFAIVAAHWLVIASEPNREGVPRRTVTIDPIHVTHLEPLGEPAS